jgi:glyoxylase-like metal-dependent hydrolase (beta-lactamase superfamily II)
MLIKIRYGNTNTFFIKGTGAGLLVDTDFAGTLPAFYKAIKAQGIQVSDITYLLCTHYHPDHCGLASELMSQGVKLVVMEPQLGSVHYSDPIFARMHDLEYVPVDEGKAVVLSSAESRSFLAKMGINGEIISTPSHSEDSICVMLDEGICLAGDLEPYEYLAAYADNAALKADWDKVLSYSPKSICYAHANEKLMCP